MTSLLDGTKVIVRQDSSTMWLVIVAPKPGDNQAARVIGMESPTEEEKDRWSRTITATSGVACDYRHFNEVLEPRPRGVEHPEGWFTAKDCYRNEADEAAALARWRERTGR